MPTPLHELPTEVQQRVRAALISPHEPPKYINFGLARIRSRAWYEWHRQHRRERRRVRRLAIAERDGWCCGICGGLIAPADLHIDHIVPLCQGGSSHPENLQATHGVCNLRKGGK